MALADSKEGCGRGSEPCNGGASLHRQVLGML